METTNYLGDHVSWTLLLLVPLYWIWTDVKILLIAQAAVLASGRFDFSKSHGIAQGAGQAVEDRRMQQESLDAFGQLVQDLFNQVVKHKAVAAGKRFDEAGGVFMTLD